MLLIMQRDSPLKCGLSPAARSATPVRPVGTARSSGARDAAAADAGGPGSAAAPVRGGRHPVQRPGRGDPPLQRVDEPGPQLDHGRGRVDVLTDGTSTLAAAGVRVHRAIVYVAANAALDRRGARHRKRSGAQQPTEDERSGSGAAIAIGALLDGIPESVVPGAGLLAGGGVSPAVLAAVVISNVPEGLSSAAGMKQAGRCARYVFGVWGGIAVLCGLAHWSATSR